MYIGSARSEELRELITRPHGVITLGVPNALGARLLAKLGYECVYVGGYAAAAELGLLDRGLYPSDFMIRHGKGIAEEVDIPVAVDMDEGGGGVLNIRKNFSEVAENTRIALVHMEDQVPGQKRCGQHKGKVVFDRDIAVQRMRCAVDTIRGAGREDLLFMARTDAFIAAGHAHDEKAGGDINEATARAVAYADIGADAVWCEFHDSHLRNAYERFAKGVHREHPRVVLGFNLTPSIIWDATSVTRQELNDMGYKFLFCTYGFLIAQMFGGSYLFAKDFKEAQNCLWALIGLQETLRIKFPEFGDPSNLINNLLGISEAARLEERYDPTAAERFATSVGHR